MLVAAAPPFLLELNHWALSCCCRIACPCLGAGWFVKEGLADAIVDRITANAHKVTLTCKDSLRGVFKPVEYAPRATQ